MNVTQIKDAIRYMSRSDKIEIDTWLDGELVGDLPSRIGSRRSIAICQEIERTWKLDDKASSLKSSISDPASSTQKHECPSKTVLATFYHLIYFLEL